MQSTETDNPIEQSFHSPSSNALVGVQTNKFHFSREGLKIVIAQMDGRLVAGAQLLGVNLDYEDALILRKRLKLMRHAYVGDRHIVRLGGRWFFIDRVQSDSDLQGIGCSVSLLADDDCQQYDPDRLYSYEDTPDREPIVEVSAIERQTDVSVLAADSMRSALKIFLSTMDFSQTGKEYHQTALTSDLDKSMYRNDSWRSVRRVLSRMIWLAILAWAIASGTAFIGFLLIEQNVLV